MANGEQFPLVLSAATTTRSRSIQFSWSTYLISFKSFTSRSEATHIVSTSARPDRAIAARFPSPFPFFYSPTPTQHHQRGAGDGPRCTAITPGPLPSPQPCLVSTPHDLHGIPAISAANRKTAAGMQWESSNKTTRRRARRFLGTRGDNFCHISTAKPSQAKKKQSQQPSHHPHRLTPSLLPNCTTRVEVAAATAPSLPAHHVVLAP